MPELKPAYLIHGDDHGAIAERRAGLRTLAEGAGGGAGNVELLEGDTGTPAAVAQALSTMTLAIGGAQPGAVGRVILVEGVERWRQADVEKHLAPVMADMPPETTLALFAREDARAKAPAALHQAVAKAGGQVVAQMNAKPWELARWVREQAARMNVALEGAAAKALVDQVGQRQQRLLRELEKLALESEQVEGTTPVGVEDIEDRAAHSAERRTFSLADALVAGDGSEAALIYLRLRGQGERLSGLTYTMAQRLRDALDVAVRLRAGESAATVKRSLRMPARAAERFVAEVARTDPDRLRRGLGVLAELELDSRGGAVLSFARTPAAGLDEDTLALRAIERITS
jgi:DNA polymerase III subunit delta